MILPFYKFPEFLDKILRLLKIENNAEIRFELLQLVGCLGAIDYFEYKKITQRMKEALGYHNQFYSFDEIN